MWVRVLDSTAEGLAASLALLSPVERSRARRFRFGRDMRRFVEAHLFLRSVLGGYMGVGIHEVALHVAPSGKPVLAPEWGLHFNLTHSDAMAVCAVARHPVGVDVERLRPLPEALEIGRRFFSAAEVRALRQSSEGGLRKRFFTCWTRKEAYLKGTGEGLGGRLDTFSVSADANRPALLECEGGRSAHLRWTLANLEVGPDYVGAAAVEAPAARIVHVCPRS